jgi:hexosaminidase
VFKSVCLILFALSSAAAGADGRPARSEGAMTVALVPQPVKLEQRPGAFTITPGTRVVAQGTAIVEAGKLQDFLAPALGFRLALIEDEKVGNDAIALRIDDSLKDLGEEAYYLSVSPTRVLISAPTSAGLFYGVQTLRQLLPPEVFRKAMVDDVTWSVPCVEIVDYPRFQWRGLLLDPARHFLPRSFLLKFIDVMAVHKFNRLQLHLTDDQGWRIEIKKYPKLTEVGAWRDETVLPTRRGTQPADYDGRRHGGYYTQDDIREIVRYAAQRHVTLVPEIEMPGHTRAAISAYPHLGCNPDKPLKPWTHWGICRDILNPTDETVAFMQDVLSEVIELFPGRFIHIGGDEAAKDQWQASPAIQARIRQLGLKDEAELQSWFIKQMDAFLTRHDRRLIGWDEILEGGVAPGAAVMSWRGEAGGIAAAQAGHDVVMAPISHTYLNFYQGPAAEEPPAAGRLLPLNTVYEFEPIPKELNDQQTAHILGAQAQLWGEFLPATRQVEYMAYPRAAALAEVVWTPVEQRDYGAFLARLRRHLDRLQSMDVNCHPLEH